MSRFKLYPQRAEALGISTRWWSEKDYKAVLDAMARTGAKRVLEFGPGSSTLALIEGGATSVDTLECDPDWAQVYEERLVTAFPDVVRLHRYNWANRLAIPAVDAQQFDLALIDGPHGTPNRPTALRYALKRCAWVLMPTEEHDGKPWLRPIISGIAKTAGRPVEFMETGPLSGAFALVGPKA